MPGLIERYRDRLPVRAPTTPSSRCRRARRRWSPRRASSDRVGAEVFLKIEGANPTGSFKDRGMTCAVSDAVRNGAEAVLCASTGNTAASLAAYAARAGIRGAVIVPEGKIATGKLAQALMHGARVIALRGNFDVALKLVREVCDRQPIALVNSVNPFRIEGPEDRVVRDPSRSSATIDALCIPVGNAGNVTAYWKGFQEIGESPRMLGFQAAGAAPLVEGRVGREPRDDRQRDPHRQPGALGGGDGGDDRLARHGARGHRRGDPRRLPLPGRRRGRLLRAGERLGRRGAAEVRRARGRARGSSASSPATASRTRRRR